jgi:hypothetical protein
MINQIIPMIDMILPLPSPGVKPVRIPSHGFHKVQMSLREGRSSPDEAIPGSSEIASPGKKRRVRKDMLVTGWLSSDFVKTVHPKPS